MSQQTNFKTEQTDFNKSLNTMVIETDNLKMELFSCTNDVCERTDHYYLIVTDTITDNLQDRRCFPIYDRLKLSEAFAIMEGLLGDSYTKILRFDINNHLSHVNSEEAKETCRACNDSRLMELFFYMVEDYHDTMYDIQFAFDTIMYIADNHEYMESTTFKKDYNKCPIERFFTKAFYENGFGASWKTDEDGTEKVFPSEHINDFLESDYSNAMCEVYDETRRRKEWWNKCTEHDTTFRFYLNSRAGVVYYKPLQIIKKYWRDPDPDRIDYEIITDNHRTKGRDGFLEIYCNDCENVEGAMWLEFMY